MLGICGAVAQLTELNEACGVVQLSLISQVSHEKSGHHENARLHVTGNVCEVVKHDIIKVIVSQSNQF